MPNHFAHRAVHDALSPLTAETVTWQGRTTRLARDVTNHWLIGLDRSNPALIAMLKERDHKPWRELLPWSGSSPANISPAAITCIV